MINHEFHEWTRMNSRILGGGDAAAVSSFQSSIFSIQGFVAQPQLSMLPMWSMRSMRRKEISLPHGAEYVWLKRIVRIGCKERKGRRQKFVLISVIRG